MKRTINALLCIVLASLALSARGQVVPSATGRKLTITAGGMGSVFQPDYAGSLTALTSPNRLYGAGVYVDVRVSRWLQFEAEGRWLNFNQYYSGVPPTGNGESNYLAGYRLPFPCPATRASALRQGSGRIQHRKLPFRSCDHPGLRRRHGLPAEQALYHPRLRLRVPAVADHAHAVSYGVSVGLGYKVF